MEGIAITLPAQTWQAMMAVLAQRPYAEVAQLLSEMDRQIKAAMDLGIIEETGSSDGRHEREH